MNFAKIIHGEIVFRDKEHPNVFQMFETRFHMFQQVYTHPKVRAIEMMVIDALKEADPYLNLSSSINNVEEFLLLTDSSVTQRINWLKCSDFKSEDQQRIRKAQNLLERIDRRDIYRFCGQFEISMNSFGKTAEVELEKITANFTPRVLQSCAPADSGLRESDIITDWNTISFGMNEKNPMDCVKFYMKDNETETIKFIDSPYKTDWESHFPRVYCRNNLHADALQSAFNIWRREYVHDSACHVITSGGGSREESASPAYPSASRNRLGLQGHAPIFLTKFPLIDGSNT